MIVWLASYPRSGNTLLRAIIHQVFGASTHSLYDDLLEIASNPQLSGMVGHVTHGRNMEDFVRDARAAGETYFVKTHALPTDDSPAIYVIRDGRAAMISLWHYWHDFSKEPAALEDIVLGDVFCGAWSDHLSGWRPAERPGTLLLRFERLIDVNAATIAAIGEVLKLKPTGTFAVGFDNLQQLDPKFFRGGSDSRNIAELEARCPELFWLRHGPAMVAFGYAAEDSFGSLPPDRRKRLCDELLHRKKLAFRDSSTALQQALWERDELLKSTSWRLTAPIRMVGRVLQRVKARL